MPDELALLAQVLEQVRHRTGLDFTSYRATTMLRRVRNRMIAAGVRTLPEYRARLEVEPAEAAALVERLTIKVSWFFRDAATFTALREAIRPWGTAAFAPRVWSAGCGQGEEPYSLAVLLDEVGVPARDGQILATDIDPAALAVAAEGRYPEAALQEASPALIGRVFEEAATGPRRYRVREDLRRRVAPHLHDLLGTEPPPGAGPFHLICCRNVLIYLQRPVQERVQQLLARHLAPGGLLCLGEAEWLLPPVAAGFEVIDRRARLFRDRSRSVEVGCA